MEYECDVCSKKFDAKDSLGQHKSMTHPVMNNAKGKINFKKYFIPVALILIIGLISATAYINSLKPGGYDYFAKCLAEKNVIVYGNDFCTYTNQQLGFFGKSKKYLKYVTCADNKELCDSKGVKITPTWEINGTIVSGVQDLKLLSELSGCKTSA